MTSRSRRPTLDAASGSAVTATPADGSAGGLGRHWVDRAREYRRLVREQGWSQATVARRKRKSRGYVSVLVRLGDALHGLSDAQLTPFRAPTLTFRAAQQLARGDATDDEIRARLLDAARRPRTRVRRRKRGVGATLGVRRGPHEYTIELDPAWAEQDPIGFLHQVELHLGRVLRAATDRVRAATAHAELRERAEHDPDTAELRSRAVAGMSIRALSARAPRTAEGPPAGDPRGHAAVSAALRRLEALTREIDQPPAGPRTRRGASGPAVAGVDYDPSEIGS